MGEKGFTLLELIIVIIVIGILASIALPKFLVVAEKGRLAEGLSVLTAIRTSQLNYKVAYGFYANDLAKLDVEFTTIKYFLPPSVWPAADDNFACAMVMRNGNNTLPGWGVYKFYINANGRVDCTPSGGAINECTKLGY